MWKVGDVGWGVLWFGHLFIRWWSIGKRLACHESHRDMFAFLERFHRGRLGDR